MLSTGFSQPNCSGFIASQRQCWITSLGFILCLSNSQAWATHTECDLKRCGKSGYKITPAHCAHTQTNMPGRARRNPSSQIDTDDVQNLCECGCLCVCASARGAEIVQYFFDRFQNICSLQVWTLCFLLINTLDTLQNMYKHTQTHTQYDSVCAKACFCCCLTHKYYMFTTDIHMYIYRYICIYVL